MSLLLRLVVLADVPDTPPAGADGGGGSSAVLIVVGVALLVLAAIGVWLLIRRSGPSS